MSIKLGSLHYVVRIIVIILRTYCISLDLQTICLNLKELICVKLKNHMINDLSVSLRICFNDVELYCVFPSICASGQNK